MNAPGSPPTRLSPALLSGLWRGLEAVAKVLKISPKVTRQIQSEALAFLNWPVSVTRRISLGFEPSLAEPLERQRKKSFLCLPIFALSSVLSFPTRNQPRETVNPNFIYMHFLHTNFKSFF